MAGSAFSLGWVMAQLFDARRLTIDELFIDCDLQDAGGPDEPF